MRPLAPTPSNRYRCKRNFPVDEKPRYPAKPSSLNSRILRIRASGLAFRSVGRAERATRFRHFARTTQGRTNEDSMVDRLREIRAPLLLLASPFFFVFGGLLRSPRPTVSIARFSSRKRLRIENSGAIRRSNCKYLTNPGGYVSPRRAAAATAVAATTLNGRTPPHPTHLDASSWHVIRCAELDST